MMNNSENNQAGSNSSDTREWTPLPKEEAPSVGKQVTKEILSWVKTIALGVIIGVLIVVFVVQRDNVYGDSMCSTLQSGDIVFTEKISTYFKNYDRGDIVILDGSGMEGYNHEEYLIKRIIGLPGETVKIENGKVYIMENDSSTFVELQEEYLDYGLRTDVVPHGLINGYDCIKLGDNEYFCLGDNRPLSNDSRNLGPFTEDRIKGIAFIRVYPLDKFGVI